MTIPGTVEKTTSAMGRSNSNSNAKSPTKAVQIKKPGITAVKRKQSNNPVVASKSPTANPAKKNKKSSSSSINSSGNNNKTFKSTAVASPVALFDLEVTICPICDEACTCPKTATIPVVKSPVSKKTSNEILNSKKPKLINKKKNRSSSGKGNSNSKKETAKNVKKYEISSEDSEEYYEEEEEESEGESTGNSTALVEDPALSFIRMIYSDEESLDEEEAYALYQATQLFSSSSDEGEEEESFEESYGEDEEEEVEESGDEFEYTVVEYVQPTKKQIKKSTEFVAYESGDESELKDNEIREQGNLLLNAENNSDLGGESSADDDEDDEGDDEENWLTYSVFDIDRDLALNQSTGSSSAFTSLSSHGSGTTPDTLLFSTSSTDKIPNIAPQVLAAISAAAKHMANQRSESTNGTSKYFSYITLRDPFKNEEVNEEEFLFFEEPEPEPEQEHESIDEQSDSVNSDVRSDDEIISIGEFESLSEDFSSNESVTEIILPSSTSKKIIKTPINIQTTPASITTTTNEYINRWNRVPIGAFRRSRRPSIPAFNYIHPSMALKTFSTDPTNFTGANSTTGGEDSFDESSITPMERSYSVITLDELDLDLDITTNPCTSNTLCPLPKRSRSVMASSNSLVNNFEWLNNNWNWEI
jgi:hypothetical protein